MSLLKNEAFELLNKLGAPEALIVHVTLVGEAADALISELKDLGVELDFEFIRTGVVLHDIGKINHTGELSGPGSEHEPEGEKILINEGVSPRLARVCLSHARWDKMQCSFEELIIALADALWKGKRMDALELDVIDRTAHYLQKQRWDVFSELDSKFEEIASGGHERLQRSMNC